MKVFKKFIAVITAAVITAVPLASSAAAADNGNGYEIKSTYENVDWGEWKAYKGNLHTHSSVSDGSESFRNMIYAAYEQNYDILAFSEHGITGRAWDKNPVIRPLYLYQIAAGYDRKPLSSDEFNAIQCGTAENPKTGTARGKGMLCVTGANELNGVTISKSHVNGYFLPENVANMEWGYENGYDYALSLVEKYGGISHINHPSDWLGTGDNEAVVSDPKNVDFFADFLLRYKSCLGIEAMNGFMSLTRYDRIMWDNLLMKCLPYGKNVYGFAGADAHNISRLNSCFMYFMMDELSTDALRTAMENGAFFGATHSVYANSVIGPENYLSAPDGVDQPLAVVNSLKVDGHKIIAELENASYVNWIANGRVIAKTQIDGEGTALLDLDEFDTSEMLYVRAEIYNENGMVFSQAMVIDHGNTPLEYTNEKTAAQKIIFALKSTRIYVLFERLFMAIAKKTGCGM